MRVSFTGKGGSGKSTLAALFVRHLALQGSTVLAVDADINVHLGSLLGVSTADDLALSLEGNVRAIRTHLMGGNTLIGGVERFLKSTPPGPGSRLVTLDDDDPVIRGWSVRTPDGARFAHVGTYEADAIGASCYHTNLGILENLLSHLVLEDGQWVVCDMVAGTDAFSNTLHAQFDRIFVVVEPTPESVTVAVRYLELADVAGVQEAVALVGNKVADEGDRQWLTAALGRDLVAELPHVPGLKRARQAGRPASPADLGALDVLPRLEAAACSGGLTGARRAALLRSLHLRLAEQDWVRAGYGDVLGQLADDSDHAHA